MGSEWENELHGDEIFLAKINTYMSVLCLCLQGWGGGVMFLAYAQGEKLQLNYWFGGVKRTQTEI